MHLRRQLPHVHVGWPTRITQVGGSAFSAAARAAPAAARPKSTGSRPARQNAAGNAAAAAAPRGADSRAGTPRRACDVEQQRMRRDHEQQIDGGLRGFIFGHRLVGEHAAVQRNMRSRDRRMSDFDPNLSPRNARAATRLIACRRASRARVMPTRFRPCLLADCCTLIVPPCAADDTASRRRFLRLRQRRLARGHRDPRRRPRWNARNEINELTRRQVDGAHRRAASAPPDRRAQGGGFSRAYLDQAAIEEQASPLEAAARTHRRGARQGRAHPVARQRVCAPTSTR